MAHYGFKMQLVLLKYPQEAGMKHKSNKDSICPVARSLDVVGEWWSLLIVRDAMLGVKRFSEFERRLGMAKNILTTRLKRLVEAGVLRVVPASDGSAYSEYELTEKGNDLLPTMVALRQWGEKYMFGKGDEHSELFDNKNHKPLAQLVVRSADGRALGTGDVELAMSSDAAARANKRRRHG
jgi:DNA-binding HxlR family transcriptional regulator